MRIQTIPSGPFSTNAYVVWCEATKHAAIVDPSPNSFEKILQTLRQHHLECDTILLTHSHWDHIADTSTLKERLNAKVYIHRLDAKNLQEPGSDGLPCWIDIAPVEPDVYIDETTEITVGELHFQVIHTPGHSPGGVCFFETEKKVLISGDTLFQGTIGNLSFSTGDPLAMCVSLQKLKQLPLDTLVYPGHGPATTIRDEMGTLERFT